MCTCIFCGVREHLAALKLQSGTIQECRRAPSPTNSNYVPLAPPIHTTSDNTKSKEEVSRTFRIFKTDMWVYVS